MGDRLIEFDGQVVTDGEQFRLLVLASSNPTVARVVRPGHDDPVELHTDCATQTLCGGEKGGRSSPP